MHPTLHKTEGITVKFGQHVILKTQITFKKPKLTLLHLITQLQPLCPCPMIEEIKRGERKLTGENLKVVWVEFSTLS